MSAPKLKPAPRARDSKDSVLRRWTGPLTEDLTLRPGNFGLGKVPARLRPDATTRSVCGYCSTGCSLDVHMQLGMAVNLTPTVDYPVNLGMACPKGWEALTPLAAPDRATQPLLRKTGTDEFEPVNWDEAMQVFTLKFKALMDQHGPESVAFLSTGQMCTEEQAFLGALWKFGMGALHGDSNTRQCMATSNVAYRQSFGFDAPPYTYADFEESDALVFIGSNLCIAHPILWQRVMRNKKNPEIIVIDPRRTETAMNATQHLALAPKSDITLLYGIAHLLIQNQWINREFIERSTTGFAEFAEFVREFTPDRVATETGLSVRQLYGFAETIGTRKAVSFWWTMGVNQGHESTRTAQALINLALMTGNIGRPGTGANSITGQCNAMGSRLFANTTNLLGGHDFTKPEHRAKVAATLGIDAGHIPAVNSLAYDQILEQIHRGKIRGLWIVATNSAHSWINQSDALDVLGRLDFLVVQDMYATTETAQRAHLVLPAAGWGEKDGTFINSERRIGLIKRVAHAPGKALADFYICKLIADAWGCGDMFERWSSPEAVFRLLAQVTRGQPCDISGLVGYADLEGARGVQWPVPDGAAIERGERRLFADGRFYHPDGKARFVFGEPQRLPEVTDAAYPYTLLTGRGSSSQWHTLTRTGKSAVLDKLGAPTPYVEVSPVDATALGIRPGQTVVVESRRGRMTARAFVTHGVQPGQLFIPMHYARTNQLTFPAFDPESRQPGYKACAVAVRPIGDGERAEDL